MPASTEQKVDFLLKKIGYTASKSGLAEDSSLSGTKKAPFAESIPSPLATPSTNIWADSTLIPATPPGSDTSYVKGYRTATALRMTADSTVSGSRAFIAYTTYNNTSTPILGDWIDTQFGADYIVKVYKGDPNSGGTQLSAAGAGSNDTWFFDYASGILNFNGTQIPSGVSDTNIYIVGYRYIGAKGARPAAGIATFTDLYVTGLSTFVGVGTFNSHLYVGGNLEVKGTTKFEGGTLTLGDSASDNVVFGADVDSNIIPDDDDTYDLGSNGQQWRNLYLDGIGNIDTAVITDLNVTGVTTLGGAVDINNNVDVSGFIDVDGQTTLDDLNVSGVSTLGGAVDINNNVDVSGYIDVDGQTTLDDLNVSGVSTFGDNINLASGKRINLGSTNQAIAAGGSGIDIEAYSNKNIKISTNAGGGAAGKIQLQAKAGEESIVANADGSVDIYYDNTKRFSTSGIGVTITGEADVNGDLNVSGVSTFAGALDVNNNVDISGYIDVDGQTTLDDLNVSGVSTFAGAVDINNNVDVSGYIDVDGQTTLDDLNVAGVSTFNDDVTFVGASNNAQWDKSENALHFNDNAEATFGNTSGSPDLSIYHNATDSLIKNSTNKLKVLSNKFRFNNVADNKSLIFADDGGAVQLYFDGSKKFSTTGIGVSIHNGVGDTATIAGPSNLIIDPGVVGNDTGSVRIKGDLYVDGTNFTVSSGTIELADHVVGIATTSGTNAILDGGGIGIGSANIRKTLLWNNASSSLKSSENFDLLTGKVYKIHGTEVLSATRLGSGVIHIDGTIERLTVKDLNVTGVSTFAGAIDINNNVSISGWLDVDGQTTLDDLNVSGVSTFAGSSIFNGIVDINNNVDISGYIDVDGQATFDDVNVSGVTTTGGLLDINAGGQANTFKVEDLTNNRVVISGTGGELEDDANLTFDGSKLLVGVELDVDGQATLDDLNVSGVSTFAGALDVNNNVDVSGYIDVDGQTTLDDLNVSGVSTLGGAVDINNNVDVSGYIDVDGQTTLDDLNVSGVSTFAGNLDINASIDVSGNTVLNGDVDLGNATSDTITATGRFDSDIVPSTDGARDLGASGLEFKDLYIDGTANIDALLADTAKIGDLTDNRVVIAGTAGELEDDSNLTFNGSTLSVGVALDVDGQATLDDLNVSGVSTFASNLDINNNVDISGFIDVDGQTTLDDLNVSGVSTLTDLRIGNANSIDIIRDEDDMASDDVNALATQQSIKAYVDDQVTAQDLDFQGDSGGTLSIDLDSEVLGILGTTNEIETVGSGNNLTIGLPNNVTITRDLTVGLGLAVTGVSTFTGALDINNNVNVSGFIDVDGQTTLDDLNVSGISTFGGLINASADIKTDAIRRFTDSSTTTKILLNDEALKLHAGHASQEVVKVESDQVSLNNGANLNVSGVSTFAGALDVNSNVDVSGFIDVDGQTTLDDLNVSGVSTFAGALDVNNNVNVSGFIDVDGQTTLDDLNVSGVSTLTDLRIGNTNSIDIIRDEDDMASNDVNALATQQSIKAYVDNSSPGGSNLTVSADSGANQAINLATEVLDIEGTSNEIVTVTGTNKVVVGLPDAVTIPSSIKVGTAGTVITGLSTGFVGINSTSPDYMLDVGGVINSSTDVKVNGVSVALESDVVALAIALG